MTAALECRDLHAGYGGTAVVRRLDLRIEAGEVVAMLGPNGAGKTTTLLTLCGFLPAVSGTVLRKGEPVHRADPVRTARGGVILVPDDRALFSSLTVREHLKLAGGKTGLTVAQVLEYFPKLESRLTVPAGTLSGGEQQMLAIGRALAQRPEVVIIDELSMGLAPVVVEGLLPVLARIAKAGTAVLLVEQHVHLALEVADRAVVLVHGSVALDGPAQDLLHDQHLLEQAYLTGSEGRFPRVPALGRRTSGPGGRRLAAGVQHLQ